MDRTSVIQVQNVEPNLKPTRGKPKPDVHKFIFFKERPDAKGTVRQDQNRSEVIRPDPNCGLTNGENTPAAE